MAGPLHPNIATWLGGEGGRGRRRRTRTGRRERERGGGVVPLLKSRDPHLAGGEAKYLLPFDILVGFIYSRGKVYQLWLGKIVAGIVVLKTIGIHGYEWGSIGNFRSDIKGIECNHLQSVCVKIIRYIYIVYIVQFFSNNLKATTVPGLWLIPLFAILDHFSAGSTRKGIELADQTQSSPSHFFRRIKPKGSRRITCAVKS